MGSVVDVVADIAKSMSHMGTITYNVRYSVNSFIAPLAKFLQERGKSVKNVKGLTKTIFKLWTTDPDISQHNRTEFKKIPFAVWLKFVTGGLVRAGEVYGDEGEWLVKDKKLKVPKGSALYVTKGKLYDGIIDEYDLDRHYKIKRIDHAKMEKAKVQWMVRRMG